MSADGASISYYQEIQEYIEAKNSTAKIIGNMGISPIDEITIQEDVNVADTLVTFENTGEVYRNEYTAPS